MTAAHKTLTFGTMVEATNLANGKMVTVEITDRGPYGAGRVLDLSSGAFEQLASLGAGVINVGYKILPPQ
jgi:rare lipoprotein A